MFLITYNEEYGILCYKCLTFSLLSRSEELGERYQHNPGERIIEHNEEMRNSDQTQRV